MFVPEKNVAGNKSCIFRFFIIAVNINDKFIRILRERHLYCSSQDDKTEGVILNTSEESRFAQNGNFYTV